MKEEVMFVSELNAKKVKDLTVQEFKHLIQESIAEDIEAWRETFEILADKNLMKQIQNAEIARLKKNTTAFVPWEKIKQNV
jgi:hypothetical protein